MLDLYWRGAAILGQPYDRLHHHRTGARYGRRIELKPCIARVPELERSVAELCLSLIELARRPRHSGASFGDAVKRQTT